MATRIGPECSFLIPLRRDKNLSDGKRHRGAAWTWLREELMARFAGFTIASQTFVGSYSDPDTSEEVSDDSRKFYVAIPDDRVDNLRRLLQEACVVFRQKCIYLSVAARVEFVEPES